MVRTSQRDDDLRQLRGLLQTVMRGLWRRRKARVELRPNLHLTPRHLALLAHIGTNGPKTIGELAADLDLSLPATSKLAGDLDDNMLVRRSEHVDDRRRTVVDLNALTAKQVSAWLEARDHPFRAALDTLTADERRAFLKGLHALAHALMEESACGPLRPDDRASHRRRHHRHRSV